jgi:hypothetical protein
VVYVALCPLPGKDGIHQRKRKGGRFRLFVVLLSIESLFIELIFIEFLFIEPFSEDIRFQKISAPGCFQKINALLLLEQLLFRY